MKVKAYRVRLNDVTQKLKEAGLLLDRSHYHR